MNAAKVSPTSKRTQSTSKTSTKSFIPSRPKSKKSRSGQKLVKEDLNENKQLVNSKEKNVAEKKETQGNDLTEKQTKNSSGGGKVISLQRSSSVSSEKAPKGDVQLKEKKKEQLQEKTKDEKSKEKVQTNTNPNKDEKFQKSLRHISKSAEEQQTHKPSETKVVEVQRAAQLPESEQSKKNDQKQHIGTMDAVAEESKESSFTAADFKEALLENLNQLEDKLPRNEEDAEDFKREKPIADVKENISSQVKEENEKLTGPMAQEIEREEPPSSDLPVQEEEQIPEDPTGDVPQPVDAKASVPKKKQDSEISMEEESASLDSFMEENEVTETQLQNSNEPQFSEALATKSEAQQKAAEAPQNYRSREQNILNTAAGKAEHRSREGFGQMHATRLNAFNSVDSKQQEDKEKDKQEQRAIFEKLENIYNKTKEDVNTKLTQLSEDVDTYFSTEAERAKATFESNVEEKLDDIYGWTTIDDTLFGEDTEAIENVFVEEKEKFINEMDTVLDNISRLIADELNAAIAIINKGRKESDDFFNSLSEEQQQLASEAMEQFSGQYDSLEETVREKENELVQELTSSYNESVEALRESFDSIKDEVSSGWIDAALGALRGVVEAIMAIKNMFLNLLASVIEAVGAIIQDPIGFLGNLIDGVKQGFLNFGANIKKHLLTGLVEWLTGSLQGVGITMPENLFSLSGIFNLSMQILGLTWDYFRAKAVKHIGEPIVQALETGFEMFQIIRNEGISGLWEYIKDSFNDLKETVIEAIKGMIITKVIEAGIKWVLGLMSPAGAFVKAAMMIIDIVKFFIERAAQIFELVTAFTNSIRQLAAGNVSEVAKAIENALAKALPVMIGFLASLLGITGLTKKVQDIIKKIRKRVDDAIEKLIKKAKKWGKKLFAKLKGKKNKKQKNEDIASGKLEDTEVGKVVNFKAGKEDHKLWIDTSGSGVDVVMASVPDSMENKFNDWDKKADELEDDQKKATTKSLIARARSLTQTIDTDATKLEGIMEEAQKKPDNEKIIKDADRQDDSVESKQDELKRILIQLLDELDNLFEIPQKVRKWIGKRVVAKTGETRFLAAFDSDLSGTNYVAYVNNKGKDNESFIIRRTKAENHIPQLYIKEIDQDNVLATGNEREYKPTHKNYEPTELKITQNSEGYYIAEYNTKTYDGETGPRMIVDVGFSDVLKDNPNVTQTRQVAGKQLKFKPEGNVRGTTDSAVSGFHNAHLIGDRFGGSGFNQSLNIYPSSKEYNVGSSFMLGNENKIADHLKTKGSSFRYDFTAKAEIKEEKNSISNVENLIKKEFSKDVDKKDTEKIGTGLAKKGEDSITKALRSEIKKDINDVPGQFRSMSYDVKDESGKQIYQDRIGEDTFYNALIEELSKELTSEGTETQKA